MEEHQRPRWANSSNAGGGFKECYSGRFDRDGAVAIKDVLAGALDFDSRTRADALGGAVRRSDLPSVGPQVDRELRVFVVVAAVVDLEPRDLELPLVVGT